MKRAEKAPRGRRAGTMDSRWHGALYMLAGIGSGLLAAALVGGAARIVMTLAGWL